MVQEPILAVSLVVGVLVLQIGFALRKGHT